MPRTAVITTTKQRSGPVSARNGEVYRGKHTGHLYLVVKMPGGEPGLIDLNKSTAHAPTMSHGAFERLEPGTRIELEV